MKKTLYLLCFTLVSLMPCVAQPARVDINGGWEAGYGRNYERLVDLPSVYGEGGEMSPSAVWYRKRLQLPDGDWTCASLELKGARFSPTVYVDGVSQGMQEGGMAPLFFPLSCPAVKPGGVVTLEIELQSLRDIPVTDASYIPPADQWRSNISSYIWDDIVLHTYNGSSIGRYIPHIDLSDKKLTVCYEINHTSGAFPQWLNFRVVDGEGRVVMSGSDPVKGINGSFTTSISRDIELWTPETPHLYTIHLELVADGKILDEYRSDLGFKSFEVRDKQFYLNGRHYPLRAGSVVWHRWVRNPEGAELGWDTTWFKVNVVDRLKAHGANTLRFHLGNPPQAILELCDRYGLLVQYEWLFFHGMNSTEESLFPQWRSWLDLAMRHPSVAIIHPYNETNPHELTTAWNVLDSLLGEYPRLVVEDRDVIHVHKYWWSLFENLGLYYDSYEQFDKAIMVDEFGGNYLDGNLELGGYPALKESYLRFLGEGHTPAMREQHLSLSNGRVAEYWRRIGAAGFSPFVILSSWEDGNHWFRGELREGNPKDVWNSLTASYSPLSLSLELWDRNFEPGHNLDIPLYLFNDTDGGAPCHVRLTVTGTDGIIHSEQSLAEFLDAGKRKVINIPVELPGEQGEYTVQAELLNRPESVKYPVVSQWDIRVIRPEVPEALTGKRIATLGDCPQVKGVLDGYGLNTVEIGSLDAADLLLLSRRDWEKIESGDPEVLQAMNKMVREGKKVILTDVGFQCLGQGYPEDKNDLGPLQRVARVNDGRILKLPLMEDVQLTFREVAEPESHIQINRDIPSLTFNLPAQSHWLWNGLRGGLIVPAASMFTEGVDMEGFIKQWEARGADKEKLLSEEPYYAYALEGYYEFSSAADDEQARKKLRERVFFIVEDAPALAISVDPGAPIMETDLRGHYKIAKTGRTRVAALARAGKNLGSEPIQSINFESGGSMIISQAMMNGRLTRDSAGGLYDLKYDPAAVQLLFNLMNYALEN